MMMNAMPAEIAPADNVHGSGSPPCPTRNDVPMSAAPTAMSMPNAASHWSSVRSS